MDKHTITQIYYSILFAIITLFGIYVTLLALEDLTIIKLQISALIWITDIIVCICLIKSMEKKA